MPNKSVRILADMVSWNVGVANQVFDTYAQAYAAVTPWIAFYNERRHDRSWQDWPPAVFYQLPLRAEVTLRVVQA